MVEVIRSLQERAEHWDRQLAKVKGRQVGTGSLRDSVRGYVDGYFRSSRGLMQKNGLAETLLLPCDQQMQALLAATQHHTSVPVYRRVLKGIRTALQALERVSLVQAVESSTEVGLDSSDQRIIDTLKKLVPSAALSYEQAVLDLQQSARVSWRGPATDLREALRECLDHLAPDGAVESQPGYKREPQTTGPTMKQKVRYVLRTRGMPKSATQTSEEAAVAVEEAVGAFVRSVYTRSSVSTHTPTEKSEVLRVRDWVRVALRELLEIQ